MLVWQSFIYYLAHVLNGYNQCTCIHDIYRGKSTRALQNAPKSEPFVTVTALFSTCLSVSMSIDRPTGNP